MGQSLMIPEYNLPQALIRDLRRQNPWWIGAPQPPLPPFRRWPFERLKTRLHKGLAAILVIRGPRQIGKTTLQQQIIADLLEEGVAPNRILRVQFDDLPSLALLEARGEPILRIADWFEQVILGEHLNSAARAGQPAFFFFDEVQNLNAWDVQLKSLVDHAAVRVLVTGSSALRIELGRDSLAGRIQTVEVGPLRLAEIAALRQLGELTPIQRENGWSEWLTLDFWRLLQAYGRAQAPVRDEAFRLFSERGAYPFAQVNTEATWQEIADHLNETVVRRVIQHDLRVGERGRKRDQQLLEEVFRLTCRYIGQSPNPALLAREVQHTLSANIGPQRIRQYVRFLDSSLLIRAIHPLEIRLKRSKGYDKLCLSDHAIRAAWLQEVVPLDSRELEGQQALVTLAGRIAESVTGYYLASLTGLDIAHLPERENEPEVDYVMTIGDHRIPVEVKYQRSIDSGRDLAGLRAYLDKRANNATFGLLITREDNVQIDDPRIVAIPLKSLLIVR